MGQLIYLRGGPYSGKTTLLQHLTMDLCRVHGMLPEVVPVLTSGGKTIHATILPTGVAVLGKYSPEGVYPLPPPNRKEPYREQHLQDALRTVLAWYRVRVVIWEVRGSSRRYQAWVKFGQTASPLSRARWLFMDTPPEIALARARASSWPLDEEGEKQLISRYKITQRIRTKVQLATLPVVYLRWQKALLDLEGTLQGFFRHL